MNETAPYSIDRSRHPVIRIRWHRDATVQDAHAYLRDLSAILAEGKRVTLLLHVAPHINFNPEERLLMSRWLSANAEAVGQLILGACFVTQSALMGMALRAVFLFSPPKHPWHITGSDPEAEKWCRNRQLGQSAAMAS